MSGPFGAGALQYFSGEKNFYPHTLDQSLTFTKGNGSFLERKPSTAGNTRVWAWSGWIKKNVSNVSGGGQPYLWYAGDASSNDTGIYIYGGTGSVADQVVMELITASPSGSSNIRTDAKLRDTTAWYHIVGILDTTQATSSNRMKLYINGQHQTDLSSSTYPTQNFEGIVNNTTYDHYIANRGSSEANMYMAEVNFIDAPIFTAATTSGSATVTGISSTASLKVGMAVSSSTTSVIPDGTTIASIDSSTQITLSANATATNGSAPLSFNATIDFFGETKQGIWIPKKYVGPYGTNGYHLNFRDDTTVEGFNTVTYTGNDSANSISGIGFSPDFVWLKQRNAAENHFLTDSVRGAGLHLRSDATTAESDNSATFTSFDGDGFSLTGSGSAVAQINDDGDTYVGWCWEAGGAPTATNSAGAGATPTAGSVKIDGSNLGSALAGTIPATKISANTTYGFSIVTYTGTGSNATVAHGLGAVPKWMIVKKLSDSQAWQVYHVGNTVDETGATVSPEDEKLTLNTTAHTVTDSTSWNDTAPTSTVFSVGSGNGTNQSSQTYVAYLWSEKAGFSKFDKYTGNGSSSGPTITVGFKIGVLLIKRGNAVEDWQILDNTRNPSNPVTQVLVPNLSDQEASFPSGKVEFTSDGFKLINDGVGYNGSGDNYIYMAFADTRDVTFFGDQSGNGNNFTPTNLTYTDSVPDVPTNNFPVINSNYQDASASAVGINSVTLSHGNLAVIGTSADFDVKSFTFQLPKSGKWYFEYTVGGAGNGWGFCKVGEEDNITGGGGLGALVSSRGGGIQSNGFYMSDGSSANATPPSIIFKKADGSTTVDTFTASQIHQVAIDVDGGKVYYGVDNTYYNSNGLEGGNPSAGTNHLLTFDFIGVDVTLMTQVTSSNVVNQNWNFGQNGDFNNTKVPQGNADKNGIGDFFYAPPTNFLALCSKNLPDPVIDPNNNEQPQDYFGTLTYTGNGSNGRSIVDSEASVNGTVNFTPNWVWIKDRSAANNHVWVDSVRGVDSVIFSNSATPVASGATQVSSFNDGGFTNGTGQTYVNENTNTYVAWNWKAGGTAVSNTEGDVTSSVSASTEAGLSIVTYTATGSGDITVGHGLGVAPEMIIGKVKNQSYDWRIFALLAGATNQLGFSNAAAAGGVSFGATAPTSTVFTAGRGGTDNMNFGAGDQVVAYCFASKEGYSKVGLYTGNASPTNGTDVFTGFRPAWVMIKSAIGGTGHWNIYDDARQPINPNQQILRADLENDETSASSSLAIDFLANGFKARSTHVNVGQRDYVYLAFAEQPFKYANAK